MMVIMPFVYFGVREREAVRYAFYAVSRPARRVDLVLPLKDACLLITQS